MAKNASNTMTSENSAELDLVDGIVLQSLPTQGRLTSMLFLATLVHGIIILGVNFTPVVGELFQEAISLEVTIVADPEPNVLEPEHAAYLAQANQAGASNTRKQVRPTARKESLVPVDNLGTDEGDSSENSATVAEFTDQVLIVRAKQNSILKNRSYDDLSPEVSTAAYLESGNELTMPLPQDIVTITEIHGEKKRELVTSVDTRESIVAGYLHRWKTRIETIGIRYFPKGFAIEGITGSPTLEVTISASGQLRDVVVRHSSGSRALDEVALSILRQAAPFDPFPKAIRIDYDQLRFAYKWQFNHLDVRAIAHTK